MAERVVDVLEAVEIEIEERKARAVAPRLDQRAVEAVVEQRAIGKPGQRIVEGEVLGLRLARLQLGRGAAQPADEQAMIPSAVRMSAQSQRRGHARE